ncbi:MAG: calcium-binding protein [Pseudomonadota bacterium]
MSNTTDHSGHAHMGHLDLMPVDADGAAALATHVAVNNGDWFDPATWESGQVPDDGALVHIPAGVSVSYEGASDANLFMVRVDGALNIYAEDGVATKLVVDTMITSTGSSLLIEAAGASDGTVDIVFAEGTPQAHQTEFPDLSGGDGILGRWQWDPEQLSLGLVASGEVDIRGQDVEAGAHLAVGPLAGATELVFNEAPEDLGWAIGHQIVVGGTTYQGRDADLALQTQDEVRTITGIDSVDGQMIVTLDRALDYDHLGPTDPATGLELNGFVGNLTRNVTISSAVADQNGDGMADRGASTTEALGADDHYVTQRGHVMFMHNDDVVVTDTAFFGLGRTDKSRPVDEIQTSADQGKRILQDNGTPGQFDPDTDTFLETDPSEVTNPRGRYAIHIHEANMVDGQEDGHRHDHGVIGPCPDTGGPICHCGHASPDDHDGDGIPNALDEDCDFHDGAYLEGNVVWGSPGWGIVQHSSKADLIGSVVYDVAGSAYVAELGDETGRWQDNLAIGTYGVRDDQANQDADTFNEDDGASGNGFYLKARAIDVVENVAVSSARAGFFFHNGGVGMREVRADDLGDLAHLAQGRDTITVEDLPIRGFTGNTVIAAREGIRIQTDPHDSVRKFNDAWSYLDDFTAWEIDQAGVSITYSSKYIFENFLILGTEDKITDAAIQASSGFHFLASVADITVLNSHVESFQNAVTNWTQIGDRQEYRRGFWDPKDPTNLDLALAYDGLGAVEGIENVAYNLWNTNIVGLTYEDIAGVKVRALAFDVETSPGIVHDQRGVKILNSVDQAGERGVEIELLGDSRDGALVALWREDIANHPDQLAMLANHIPLAYQDDVYLGQVVLGQDGNLIKRDSYLDFQHGINADIWSGTVLEFAKTDSLGRHVFTYGDFAPLDPVSQVRAVTTNERLIFTREMIDAALVADGYVTVAGIDDVKFVTLLVSFTDRISGALEPKRFLVALDLAWEMPEAAKDGGLLLLDDNLIVAPQYRLFDNGVLVEGRAPIVLGDSPLAEGEAYRTGTYATDQADDLKLGAGADSVSAGGGDDIVKGQAAADVIDGGAGRDALFGGDGWDRLLGGDGNDLLDGHLARDFLFGGDGQDQLQGGIGRDHLDGGDGHDNLLGGNGMDQVFGGDGDDIANGGNGRDTLDGGDGADQLAGGAGFDDLVGGAGDDVLSGNAGNDLLFGGTGNDLLNGGARADKLYGGDGADLLLGDAGADQLFGEDGVDILRGQFGMDKLYGGASDDVLSGGSGDDRLFGGDGADVLHGDTGDDRLTGGIGADRFVFEQNSGIDVITDFEDGIDAIEFMIESFGFEDIGLLQDGDDAIVQHQGGQLRLVSTDSGDLDEQDFSFMTSG